MIITELPSDLLFFYLNEMIEDIFPVYKINKAFNFLLDERVQKEKNEYRKEKQRKFEFLNKCRGFAGKWFINGFHMTRSSKECGYLREEHAIRYGDDSFLGKIGHLRQHTNQVAAESWEEYLSL